MKILMLCEFYNENLEFQENILTKYYSKFGHKVTIITSTFEDVFDYYSDNYDNTKPKKIFFDNKTKVIRLPYKYNYFNRIRAYENINNILEEEKPDLIYVHDIIPNMLEAVEYIKKYSNVKMIMDYHADYSNSGRNWISLKILHGIIRKWFLDRSIQYIEKIFPVVPAGKTFLHDIYKVPYDKMEVLPLGADVDLCRRVLQDKEKLKVLRNKYNISDQTKVIITGGKLVHYKKTDILIHAFRKLKNENLCLLIIGDSSKSDNYIQTLKKMSADLPNVYFTGWLNTADIYAHFHISDLAVFPASQSILWQQAIAAGLPLIVGNVGWQSVEYLNLYNNIIMLEKEDITIEQIKMNIEKLLNDTKLMKIMRNGANKVTRELLDWNVLIHKTLIN